jgi:hypothetical protein
LLIFSLGVPQEVHAPVLGLWGVKMVVVAVFFAIALPSIVSSDFDLLIIFFSLYIKLYTICFSALTLL